jgi:hypothetical protein
VGELKRGIFRAGRGLVGLGLFYGFNLRRAIGNKGESFNLGLTTGNFRSKSELRMV